MFKKLISLFLVFLFFSTPTYAEDNNECGYNGLKRQDFEKLQVILRNYVENSLGIWLKGRGTTLDSHIPRSVFINFSDGVAYIDLIFGMEGGWIFSSNRPPDNFSMVGFAFKRFEKKCVVSLIEGGGSGIIWLFIRNTNSLYNSLNLASDNDPVLYSFPINL